MDGDHLLKMGLRNLLKRIAILLSSEPQLILKHFFGILGVSSAGEYLIPDVFSRQLVEFIVDGPPTSPRSDLLQCQSIRKRDIVPVEKSDDGSTICGVSETRIAVIAIKLPHIRNSWGRKKTLPSNSQSVIPKQTREDDNLPIPREIRVRPALAVA